MENNKEKKYVFDYIIDDIKNNCLKNTFVYNEGGIGKTTQLKKLAQMLLSPEGRKYAPNVIPIYIAVKDLHGSKNKNTLFNAVKKFCGEDSSDKELEDLLDGSSSMRKDFIFLFIIDGLNEAKDEIKRELQREINNLMKFEQNVFIVSSRIDETNYFSGFDKKLFVKPLDNVCEIINASKTEINPKLLEILSIPLYLKYYLYTYKKDDFYFYEDKSVKKSDILNAYLNSIDKNLEKNTVSYDKHTKDFLIDFYLPALAYELEISNETTDENLSNIKKSIAAYTYYEKLLGVDEEDEIATLFMSDCFFPLKIAKEWFALNDKKGYFVHDIWREYFAASYYSKCIDNDIIDVFDNLPSKGVREFIGEITGECDFEEKDNLNTWSESPIEHFMQQHNMKSENPISPMATRNLIEIMKTSRNGKISAQYDSLDLKYINFYDYDLQGSSFNNTKIYEHNFIPQGHKDPVTSVSYSPNGKSIVSGSFDSTIRIWDAETRKQIGEPLIGHTGCIESVSYSPDGKNIVSGSSDKTIRIWDAETGKQLGKPLIGHTGYIESVSYSPNGKRIVSCSSDKTIRIWDAETGKQIGEPLIGHTDSVSSVSYSPDGKNIVSCSYDKTIRIWDAEKGKQIGKPLIGHTGSINSVFYSPNGKKIVSASLDRTIRIWNAETGKQIGKPLIGHTCITSVSYSPDGKKIISSGWDSTIRIWNAETGKQIGKPLIGHTGSVESVSYSPDGKRIVSGSWDNTIRIWDAETGRQIGEPLIGYTNDVYSISYSPDGKNIVSGSSDKTIRIWDAETGKQIGKPLIGHTNGVSSISYFPDGKRLVSGSFDRTIRIWDAETGKQIGEPLIGDIIGIEFASCSPNEKRLISRSLDRTIRIWDAETGKQIGEPLIGHTGSIESISYSPDGKKIVSGSWDKTIRIWDAETGKQIGEPLIGHTDYIESVSYSPNSKRIVSGSADKTIQIWDEETRTQIGKPLIGHTGTVNSVSYSPDGKNIVSGSSDKTIRIWDAKTGEQIGKPLKGHTGFIRSISYSPDGKKIVSSGKDGIRIWNLETHLCTVIQSVILSNIQNCDFRNAAFIFNDNLQTSSNNIQNSYYNAKKEFYHILYCNGADVPKEYEPSPIPFEWNDEETSDKESE